MNLFSGDWIAQGLRLSAALLLCVDALGQTVGASNGERDPAGVVFPNADWIRFPARPPKRAQAAEPSANSVSPSAAITPASKTPAPNSPSVSTNEWVQFPKLAPPKPSVAASPDKPSAKTETPAEAASDNNGTFPFKQFKFSGNTAYSDETLSKLLLQKVPTVMSVTDIQRAADTVATLYQTDGVLARVDVLPQDLTEGSVTLTISEGKFAGAQMETADSPKLPKDYLVRLVESAQPRHTPVTLGQMDKATMLLNEVPGVQASVRLSTGADQGETIALVQVQDKRPWDGQITLDNTGSVTTGAYRFSTQWSRYGFLGRGDVSNLQYLHSSGLDYARLGYSEPLGHGGTRWGANTELTKYTVVDPAYDALDLHGPATTVNGFVNHPLIRHRQFSTDVTLAADHKRFTNHSKFSTTNYQSDALTASLQANSQDPWLGGGENSASLQVTRGVIDYDTTKTDGTEGWFTKWRMGLNRKQKIDATQTLLLSFQRQRASRNLDSSEKMGIGGSGAVRAYAAGEVSGTQANLWSMEWQRDIEWHKHTYKISAFYDWGQVDKEKYATSTGLNSYPLQGVGLWLGATYPNAWGQSQWRVTWAHRLGTNPGGSNGNDADGTYLLNRFWLSASQTF